MPVADRADYPPNQRVRPFLRTNHRGKWMVAAGLNMSDRELCYRRRAAFRDASIPHSRHVRIGLIALVLSLSGAISFWQWYRPWRGSAGSGPSNASRSVPWQGGLCIVEATGRDFEWHFRMAGPDHQLHTDDDLGLEHTLHVPENTTVLLRLESDDYVYSFSAPGLKWRHVAVPDLPFQLELGTTVAGQYELIVDPMCGVRLYHDRPMGRVVVESFDSFDAWYQSQQRRR